jgi:hypothetical protein
MQASLHDNSQLSVNSYQMAEKGLKQSLPAAD